MSAVINRVLSFGRRPKSAHASGAGVHIFADGENKAPRLTPSMTTPRSTQVHTIEIERESKTAPMGFKFAMLAEYYSGVIVTETTAEIFAAGLKCGDILETVGSSGVGHPEDVERCLKAIAGTVEVQVQRSKKLPTGWTVVEENGNKVLQQALKPALTPSRPQVMLSIKTTPGGNGMALATNGKGCVVIHSVKKDSPFYKHIKPGDKLTSVNGNDISTNPVGASRAMTGASGQLKIFGTFIAPSEKCAATGCLCCAHLAKPQEAICAPAAPAAAKPAAPAAAPAAVPALPIALPDLSDQALTDSLWGDELTETMAEAQAAAAPEEEAVELK